MQELANIVSIKPLDILSIRAYFRSRSNEFKACKLKHYFHKWKELTSDKKILQTVLGPKLEILGDPPVKHNSYIPQFSKEDESAADLEIQKLFAKDVITKCEHETGEYISPIFIRQKPVGSSRLILNLKNLNEDMPYIHFKMKTLQSMLSLSTPGCYLASVDLKDAYYSVPIHPDHDKFLKFIWKNQFYKFLVLPNGLCCGPRKFTKLMKPPIATLRLDGHIIAIYIDDLINVGLTFDECVENVITSIKLFNSLEFNYPSRQIYILNETGNKISRV